MPAATNTSECEGTNLYMLNLNGEPLDWLYWVGGGEDWGQNKTNKWVIIFANEWKYLLVNE